MMIDGKCGVSVENGDSMIQTKSIRLLNSDRKLAELMNKAPRKYLQSNFTPPIIASQYFCELQHTSLSSTT